MKKLLTLILAILFFNNFAYGAEDIFNISTVNGKKLTLIGTDKGIKVKEYKGKIVFIEFWGTWCGPCLLSIPHHVKMREKYKNQLRIIAFETTPSLTKEKLANYVKSSKNIDLTKVDWFMQHKANSPEAKAYFTKPLAELKAFKDSNKPINYDVVDYNTGKEFISYIAYRAKWQGSIPFLLVLDGNGVLMNIIPGMPSEKKLDTVIQSILKHKNTNTIKKDTNSTQKEANITK